ncbi:hypothetical protein K439DRAFT_1612888 [Ramaria rubella]|nr:hypothetical protein K439DRAFT_1612888 [Ramaria rubella]
MKTNVPPEPTQMTMDPPAPASALVLGPAMAHRTPMTAEPFSPELETTSTDAAVMPPTTEPPLTESCQATVSPPLSPREQPVVSQTAIIMTATCDGTQGEGARRMSVRNIKKRSVKINLTEGAGPSGGKGKRTKILTAKGDALHEESLAQASRNAWGRGCGQGSQGRGSVGVGRCAGRSHATKD